MIALTEQQRDGVITLFFTDELAEASRSKFGQSQTMTMMEAGFQLGVWLP